MVATPAKRLTGYSGFTLLELLVVLAIAGGLMALVPPVVSAVVPGTKARVAALDLASDLRAARSQAISGSRTVDIEFDLDKATYAVEGADPNKFPRGMAITMLDFSGYGIESRRAARVLDADKYTLRFYADGSANGLRARLGSERSGYLVAVDWVLGRVTVARADEYAG